MVDSEYIESLAVYYSKKLGVPDLFEHQRDVLKYVYDDLLGAETPRLCLYYRTGAGKTATALMVLRECYLQHHDGASWSDEMLILAPPITHDAWREASRLLNVPITVTTVQMFRQPRFKVKRNQTVVVDEFHQLGGHTGKGWKKLDRMSEGLKAPLILLSATPNYNDADRVYCIQHVLDPGSCRGGFLQFLHEHCITRENPFGSVPYVEGFRNFKNAEDYLVHLPKVLRAEDLYTLEPTDIFVDVELPDRLHTWRLDDKNERFLASEMEERARIKDLAYISEITGELRWEMADELSNLLGNVSTKVFIYCDSKRVAQATANTLNTAGLSYAYIDGDVKPKDRLIELGKFTKGRAEYLIGTSAVATGTDGIDKVCDYVILLDDTPDDSLRKQILGRILPRGADSDVSGKMASRIVPRITYV